MPSKKFPCYAAGLACTVGGAGASSEIPPTDELKLRKHQYDALSEDEKSALFAKKLDFDLATTISRDEEKASVLSQRIVGSSEELLLKFKSAHVMYLRLKYERSEGGFNAYADKLAEFEEVYKQDKQQAVTEMVASNRILKAHPRPKFVKQLGFLPDFLLQCCYCLVIFLGVVLLVSELLYPAPRALCKPMHTRTKQDHRNIARYNSISSRCARLFVSVVYWAAVCLTVFQYSYVTFSNDMLQYRAFQHKLALGIYKVQLYSPKLGEDILYPQRLGTMMVHEMDIDLLNGGNLVEKTIENGTTLLSHSQLSPCSLGQENVRANLEQSLGSDRPLLGTKVTRDPFYIPARPNSATWWHPAAFFSCVISIFTVLGAIASA